MLCRVPQGAQIDKQQFIGYNTPHTTFPRPQGGSSMTYLAQRSGTGTAPPPSRVRQGASRETSFRLELAQQAFAVRFSYAQSSGSYPRLL
jgi:hypothetical protein